MVQCVEPAAFRALWGGSGCGKEIKACEETFAFAASSISSAARVAELTAMDPASVPASAAPQPTVLASQPVPSNAANTLPTPATVLAAPPPAAPQPAIVVARAYEASSVHYYSPPPLPPRASVANPSSVNLPPSVVTQVSALVPPQAPPPPVLAQPPVVRHPSLAMPPPLSNQPPLSMAPRPTTVLAPPNPVAPVQTRGSPSEGTVSNATNAAVCYDHARDMPR